MKRDTDTVKQFLLWLLQDIDSSATASFRPDEGVPKPNHGPSGIALQDTHAESWDPLDSEAPEVWEQDSRVSRDTDGQPPILDLGEIPAVQDRFQALLKRQLQLDIERRPPLFPWEKELQDYPVEMPSELASATPGQLPYLWLSQLRSLSLPATLPDELLDTLLQRCQALVQQPLKSGLRLVKAVETLFPDQPQAVERLAGMVLTPAYRSQLMTAPGTTTFTYDQANPQQQMALSLLAARQIFDTLILELSAQQPQVSRQWVTDLGLLQLTASYDADAARLRVQADLPESGQVSLGQASQRATSVTSTGGPVTVTLEGVSAQVYALEVTLAGTALQFAIHLT